MRIRVVTFTLDIPADDYAGHATDLAPAFRSWPGLLAAITVPIQQEAGRTLS